jgi:hypothetical protein
MKTKIKLSLLLVCGILLIALPYSPVSRASAAGAIGIVCTYGPTFNLHTADGYIYTPDGNSIYMWGYATGAFQAPGPVLCVNQGQTVTINMTNNLSEPVSMIFPGQSGVTASGGSCPSVDDCLFAQAADTGETVTYTFTAGEPGTYLYESGTNPDKQVQMGLYGVLVVYPSMGSDYAYNDAATRFKAGQEYLLVISEIDPAWHRAVELGQSYDRTQFLPRYWLINGRSFPDAILPNGVAWLPSQPYSSVVVVEPYDPVNNPLPALVRYANAGLANHPFHPHGNDLRVIARDGRLLRGPIGEDASLEEFTHTTGSGTTYDMLFRWDDVDPWITGGAPVPVTIPGLQNLVFKDGATFYSGDPRLGYQGELPVGVTGNNQCGEFYFPWHSHAVFEFTSFDEGFGGLATVVRIDPPGGCAAVLNYMHIGDLDGSTTNGGANWKAYVTITLHDANHNPLSGATVSGSWNNPGSGGGGATTSCTTNTNGQCQVHTGNLSKSSVNSTTFTVTGITHASKTYNANRNHDPESDSNGTSITVSKP